MNTDMDRLMYAASLRGCVTWADLARFIGESDQVITNWKTRGIPPQKILALAELVHVNPYWLRDGGEEHPMVVSYMLEKDLVDLIKVAEMLPHEYRQHLTGQGADLVKLSSSRKKEGNGWQ